MTDDVKDTNVAPADDPAGAGGTAIPNIGGTGWLGVEHEESAPASPGGTSLPSDGGTAWLGTPDDPDETP